MLKVTGYKREKEALEKQILQKKISNKKEEKIDVSSSLGRDQERQRSSKDFSRQLNGCTKVLVTFTEATVVV